MKFLCLFIGLMWGFCGVGLGADVVIDGKMLERVVFGSCYRPAKAGKAAKIWNSVIGVKPDLFLFLGDNIYADTKDMEKMRADYDQLLTDEGYGKLRKVCGVQAIWDDHDYGKNDAGGEFEAKKGAKVEFMRAFGIGEEHPMRKRGGIYHSVMYVKDGRRIQLIMLDTRWFRSALKSKGSGRKKVYLPDEGVEATILGEEQWAWLEEELKESADLRIIASSIQVVAEQHRFEKWANMPKERERLLSLVKKGGKTIVISGDRHMGEFSRVDGVLDVTSSGMTNAGGGYFDKNRHRVGKRVPKRNFGTIRIDWSGVEPTVVVELVGENGEIYEKLEL